MSMMEMTRAVWKYIMYSLVPYPSSLLLNLFMPMRLGEWGT
jgi:hypothetical protein